MIHSIFILNNSGQVIIEKHYRGNASRTETVSFWSQVAKSPNRHPLDVPPFLPTPKGALVHHQRNGLFLLASVLSDTQPLFVTQFLSALADVFEDYFGELNEHAIKDNFITVYELLDEMLDNGFPLTIEPNTLKDLISPPSTLNRVLDSLGADTQKTLISSASLIPWRRSDVKYTQNEIFVDIVETVHATFSSSRRSLSHLAVTGVVTVNSRLSGVPDITMSLRSRAALDDVALHHCVRVPRWTEGNVLSFIPPDGPFRLMSFCVRDARALSLPIDVPVRIDPDIGGAASASVSATLVVRFAPPPPPPPSSAAGAAGSMVLAQVMSAAGAKGASLYDSTDSIMDDVCIRLPFGPGVTGASLSANFGTVEFDSTTGMCTWNVGVVSRGKTPTLNGNISLAKAATTSGSGEGGVRGRKGARGVARKVEIPQALVRFRIPGHSVCGMSVDSLELGMSEKYKYYKGLRCVTKAGTYEVRP